MPAHPEDTGLLWTAKGGWNMRGRDETKNRSLLSPGLRKIKLNLDEA